LKQKEQEHRLKLTELHAQLQAKGGYVGCLRRNARALQQASQTLSHSYSFTLRTHSLTHSLIPSTRSLTFSLTHSHLLTYLLTHFFTHALTLLITLLIADQEILKRSGEFKAALLQKVNTLLLIHLHTTDSHCMPG
jgi:hypothetical protein